MTRKLQLEQILSLLKCHEQVEMNHKEFIRMTTGCWLFSTNQGVG